MAAFNKFNFFVQDLAQKLHNLSSDTVTVALTTVAPVATNHVLTDLTEVSYTNLSSRAITPTSANQTSGTLNYILPDLVLTASGAVAGFRYIVLYNSTSTNKNLIGWYDYGSTVTLASGETFTLDLDNVTGLLTIA